MNINKVYITRNIPELGVKILLENQIEVEIYPEENPIPSPLLLEKAKSCDALITMLTDKIDEHFIKENCHLKLIANYAVGFNNIDIGHAKEKNICITNTPDVLSKATAEIALGLILTVSRNLNIAHQELVNGNFKGFSPRGFLGPTIYGKTVGIIGLGKIGKEVASLLKNGFGCKILYYNQNSMDSIGEKVDLETLLIHSDIVSLHVPLNKKTENLIDYSKMALMKKTAILINTARGEVINQEDLLKILSENKIFGAGLDVTTPEPLPKDHPLLNLKNCYILPHIGSASTEARNQMSELCALNIIDYNQGIRPRNLL